MGHDFNSAAIFLSVSSVIGQLSAVSVIFFLNAHDGVCTAATFIMSAHGATLSHTHTLRNIRFHNYFQYLSPRV